ncbi:hypothetical protein OS493_037758, partial [Desmophyllum pertusum]
LSFYPGSSNPLKCPVTFLEDLGVRLGPLHHPLDITVLAGESCSLLVIPSNKAVISWAAQNSWSGLLSSMLIFFGLSCTLGLQAPVLLDHPGWAFTLFSLGDNGK